MFEGPEKKKTFLPLLATSQLTIWNDRFSFVASILKLIEGSGRIHLVALY